MSRPDISVIICTHNPRADYLRRTLDALKAQTLPKEQWELLLIDNASKVPLANSWDLSWHPHARHIREEELGLTPARLRGIKESGGDPVVYVDDDNILAPDFLAQVRVISLEYPNLGAWGCHISAEFESAPDKDLEDYLPCLAIRAVQSDIWSNFPGQAEPCGAGMSVRRKVLQHYSSQIVGNPGRRSLDRRGTNLVSAGDTDIVFTAYELGMGAGLFASIKLIHLIPSRRLEKSYLTSLAEQQGYSYTLVRLFRGMIKPASPTAGIPFADKKSFKRRLWGKFVSTIENKFGQPQKTTGREPASEVWARGAAKALADYSKNGHAGVSK
ncbi:MAG: glycosyltransferase [Limisphaerales bacterium]